MLVSDLFNETSAAIEGNYIGLLDSVKMFTMRRAYLHILDCLNKNR